MFFRIISILAVFLFLTTKSALADTTNQQLTGVNQVSEAARGMSLMAPAMQIMAAGMAILSGDAGQANTAIDQALTGSQAAIDKYPDYPEAYLVHGEASDMKSKGSGVSDFNIVISLTSAILEKRPNAETFDTRASAYKALGDCTDAANDWTAAIRMAPEDKRVARWQNKIKTCSPS